MNTIKEQVKNGKTLVSDGAWGTMLLKKGASLGKCMELWNVEHRDDVLDIARSYVEAGADMVGTNSFGGSRFKLDHYGLADRVGELNEAAASISREAAGPDLHVWGSIGPTGKILMMGDVTEEELYEGFSEQAAALESGGADACCVETMSALDEARIAVRAAKENTSLEIICTFTYERAQDGRHHTMMGVTPAQMVSAILDAGADIVGTNCSQGIDGMIEIVREIREADQDVPVLVHPNAGLPVMVDGAETYPETPELMAGKVSALVDAGANIVGGCCGTGPEHIRRIVETVGKR